MNELELERPLDGSPPDETDINLRAYLSRISDAQLHEYDPAWSDEQLVEWDGNFRSDGALMLVCCERDIEIEEYRRVLEEHIGAAEFDMSSDRASAAPAIIADDSKLGRTTMALSLEIRTAVTTDADALLEIYRPYLETTAISFELQVPAVSEFAERIKGAVERWSWLVAEVGGRPIGYAYGSAHRARQAYAYSVETSAYVRESHHRGGIARALYAELFQHLRERGYESAYAGITLPNAPSMGFHKSFGFEPVGVFPKVGHKFGKWHDVAWLYRPIKENEPENGSGVASG